MTVTDQFKVNNNKIKANQAQYDFDRVAFPSGELRKYEYLTGEDLGYKTSVIEQAKFDYSSLGKVFTKGMDKDKQKEGLFKRLENIKGKNEELLKEIKNQKTKMSDKTNSEANKTKNPLIYDPKYSFVKYKLKNLNKIPSIHSKYDMIEKCYNDFTSLMDVDIEPENIEHKSVVLKKVLYDDLITEYK